MGWAIFWIQMKPVEQSRTCRSKLKMPVYQCNHSTQYILEGWECSPSSDLNKFAVISVSKWPSRSWEALLGEFCYPLLGVCRETFRDLMGLGVLYTLEGTCKTFNNFAGLMLYKRLARKEKSLFCFCSTLCLALGRRGWPGLLSPCWRTLSTLCGRAARFGLIQENPR